MLASCKTLGKTEESKYEHYASFGRGLGVSSSVRMPGNYLSTGTGCCLVWQCTRGENAIETSEGINDDAVKGATNPH